MSGMKLTKFAAIPLGETQGNSKERSNAEVPDRIEMQIGEKNVFSEEGKMQVVFPTVHISGFRGKTEMVGR